MREVQVRSGISLGDVGQDLLLKAEGAFDEMKFQLIAQESDCGASILPQMIDSLLGYNHLHKEAHLRILLIPNAMEDSLWIRCALPFAAHR